MSHDQPAGMGASRPPANSAPSLQIAVQVGFTGTRRLIPTGIVDPETYSRAVEGQLTDELRDLPRELGLGDQHFLVAVSQMAAGADLTFSACVSSLGWVQRVLLPQLRDDYLAASGSDGPDFSPAERQRVVDLLSMPHVIEERVASTSASRSERFDDANLEILAEADVLVWMRSDDRPGRSGGSEALAQRALARDVPVLELRLCHTPNGQPRLHRRWLPGPERRFQPPRLPDAIEGHKVPLALKDQARAALRDHAAALKDRASARAGRRRIGFHRAAYVIVGTHVLATVISTLLLAKLMGDAAAKLALAVELALLAWGFMTHQRLHSERHTEDWAIARLCAEIARSARAAVRIPGSLAYLGRLPIPSELRPVLRTLEVLHLRSIRTDPPTDWAEETLQYVNDRIDDPDPTKGQLAYYRCEQAKAHHLANRAKWVFVSASAFAFGATLTKLVLKLTGAQAQVSLEWLGVFAVVLPVVAVAAMSLAAARDAEARAHVYAEMHQFLDAQSKRLKQAISPREAAALASETEMRLLGESVTWYARRAFTGIA